MATCATCGQNFSGFSFGSAPATQCPDCRRQGATEPPPTSTEGTPQFVVAVPAVPTPYVTYAIIAINAAVYLAMCATGVSWILPSSLDALRWGGDFGPLTLGGEWWRLFTSMFVHFGIIHIGLNMWCFLNLGRSLEFLMGRKAFAASYVACGVAGSIVSIWWHPMDVSAGASGAIFGTAGTFAAYVFLKRVALSPRSLKQTRNSLAAFIFYNLAFGAAIGPIDNSAHIGGLIAGAILGAIVPPIPRFRIRKPEYPTQDAPTDRSDEERRANLIAWGIIFGSAVALTAAFLLVRSVRMPYAKYGEAVHLIEKGEIDQAITRLDETVRPNTSDNFVPAEMLLGQVLLDRGSPEAAELALLRAARLDSNNLQNLQNLALAQIGNGHYSDAMLEMKNVLSAEKDKPSWDSVFIHAVATGESGDYATATRELQSVIDRKPDFAAARTNLTRFQGLADHLPEATLPSLAIPYSVLVAKSGEWPLFP